MPNASRQRITHTNVLAMRAIMATVSFVLKRLIAWMHRCATNRGIVFEPHPVFNAFVTLVNEHNFSIFVTEFWQQNHFETGFIGNGTYCTEPFRQEHAFLLLSQGVAIIKFAIDEPGNRGSPIAMSNVRWIFQYCFSSIYFSSNWLSMFLCLNIL